MAKKDTIAALKALGITPDENKTDAVLKQELAAARAAIPGAPVITPPPSHDTGEAPKPTSAAGLITVKHRDHRGEVVERTFSKDVHGDNFAALAEEFKATNADKLVQ